MRTVSQMQKVLHSECTLSQDAITYKMYRGIWQKQSIRYDITILPPLTLAGEFNKTFGHYHPKSKHGAPFPEVYEVLSGEAHFLLQTMHPDEPSHIERALLVHAKKGEIAIMQPYFGHLTINIGKTPLALANLVFANFSSEYSHYGHLHGGIYYELTDGTLLQNPHYSPCALEKMEAKEFSSAFSHPKFPSSLFSLAQKDISRFAFLENPLLLMKKN